MRKALLDLIYPVGSFYSQTLTWAPLPGEEGKLWQEMVLIDKSAPPAEALGGEWEELKPEGSGTWRRVR